MKRHPYLLLLALALAPLVAGLRARAGTASAAPPAQKSQAQLSAQSTRARLDAFWQRAKETAYRTPEELAAQNAREIRKGWIFDKLMQGNPRLRTVALTFDDGPHPLYTRQILAILKKYDLKATFFVVGKMAEKYPDLVRAEAAAGDTIGNHTYHHVNLNRIPFGEIATEWQACSNVIQSITGQEPRFARPPGGDYDRAVVTAAHDLGLTTVLWTDDPGDYASPGSTVIEDRVLDRVGNGGIILLHDGIQQTIDILPQLITRLRSRGFRFVTVGQMQAQGHFQPVFRTRRLRPSELAREEN